MLRPLLKSCVGRSSFQHFIAQDGYFLEAFAKAYAIALSKEVTSESNVFEVLLELLEGVRAELKMHSTYAANWGIDKEAFTEPSPTTLTYNSFLLKVAEGPRVYGWHKSGMSFCLAVDMPILQMYGHMSIRVVVQP